EYLRYKPTYGGARIYFKRPTDEDLLSIDASYVNEQGKTMWFSTSFIADYIDVYGFATQHPTTVALYAVDRAGNESDKISVVVEPLEPAVEQVASTIYCVAGFSSFYVNWENGLKQSINVFVDYTVEDENGVQTEN